MSRKVIRIGGASGFWGDAAMSTPQLLATDGLDYVVYDYLAEITMSILARARSEKPDLGYATDFVSLALKPNLTEIARRKVKVISNAGGVNPESCAAAVRTLIAERGLELRVAAITGDDLVARKDEIASSGFVEMFSGDRFPQAKKILAINAYLGAFPIARALESGADIVITGRCVDSAVTLGACIYEFGWRAQDLDQLAGGSLAGHILECGVQATGGNFTDWASVIDRLEDIGYPIAEISEDGSFVCTKPKGSGGTVNVGTVSEQLLYEIGDPQAYILPDVICDFSDVKISQEAPDRVRVSNARGYPPPDSYKVSTIHVDGFRGGPTMSFYGIDATQKAEMFGNVVLARARKTLRGLNLPDYTETSVEVIGSESQFGNARRIERGREAVVNISAKHPDAIGIGILIREASGLALASPPGLSGFVGGRPKPSPMARLFSFLLPKDAISATVDLEGVVHAFVDAPGKPFDPRSISRPEDLRAEMAPEHVVVPLLALAWARSGDKGDNANIGVIARHGDYFPYISRALTADAVADRFAHLLKGRVERFILPGPHALNFVLYNALGGGGVASLRNDPQGKGYAQLLLDTPVEIPAELARRNKLAAV